MSVMNQRLHDQRIAGAAEYARNPQPCGNSACKAVIPYLKWLKHRMYCCIDCSRDVMVRNRLAIVRPGPPKIQCVKLSVLRGRLEAFDRQNPGKAMRLSDWFTVLWPERGASKIANKQAGAVASRVGLIRAGTKLWKVGEKPATIT